MLHVLIPAVKLVSNKKYIVPRTIINIGQRTRNYLVRFNYNELAVEENSTLKATFKKNRTKKEKR